MVRTKHSFTGLRPTRQEEDFPTIAILIGAGNASSLPIWIHQRTPLVELVPFRGTRYLLVQQGHLPPGSLLSPYLEAAKKRKQRPKKDLPHDCSSFLFAVTVNSRFAYSTTL